MRDADTLNDLIEAAVRARVPAVHLVREGGVVTVFARASGGLSPARSAPVPLDWFEAAAARPDAAQRGDRVVIDLAGRIPGATALAELGVPTAMRIAIEQTTRAPGGLVLVASQDREALAATMTAAARGPGERHIVGIAGRADLDLAARMDCDAILIAQLQDRAMLAAAFDLAQRGQRIVLGVAQADVIAAIGALRALRVERHMLAFGLRVAIAVREEHRLCASCRRPAQAEGAESALLGVDPGTVVYRPAGCGACDGTGFDGRVMLFETVAVDPGLRRLLAEGGDAAILARHAFIAAPTLAGSARTLAREGRITVEAAIRIARQAGNAVADSGCHPAIAASRTQRLDDWGMSPLSARLRGDRSSIG